MEISYVSDDFLPIFGVIPLVFCFLWYLIVGDIKNLTSGKAPYTNYSAADPVNCYQNYDDAKRKTKET